MSQYVVTDTELESVADAIREKGGTSADLEFPADFITAIAAISGGGSGDLDLVRDVYTQFDGSIEQVIKLPYTVNNDYTIEVDFEATATSNNNTIIGTSGNYTKPHITIYNSKWYVSTGGNDLNFSATLTGRHTIILNKDNSVYYDGTAVLTNLTSASSDSNYWIGGRGDSTSNRAKAKIYGVKIKSISTGNVIADLQPAHITYKNGTAVAGFVDVENDVFYGNPNISVVGGGGSLIADWDFTQSLVDSVNGLTATLGGNAVQSSSGVEIPDLTSYISLPNSIKANARTYELEMGAMSLYGTGHHRLMMTTTSNGFIYRDNGKWSLYTGSNWAADSDITDFDYFANSTIKAVVDINGNWKIYKDGVLVYEPNRTYAVNNVSGVFYIGSTSNSCANAVIKRFKIY